MNVKQKEAIRKLFEVNEYADMKRLGIPTLYDYREVTDAAHELLAGYKARTVCEDVAKYFERLGFNVKLSISGVYYTICE